MKTKIIRSYEFFETGKIKALGWLGTKLDREVNGFAMHLDELCSEAGGDIFGNNKMSGEGGHNWWNGETEGNWIDGLTRLAFTADDDEAIRKVKKYIYHIIDVPEKDGYIGIYQPNRRYKNIEVDGELWGQSRIFLAMLAYYESTGDKRVLEAVEKAALLTISKYGPYADNRSYFKTLGDEAHGIMIVEPMLQLFELTEDKHFLDFAVFCYEDFSKCSLIWEYAIDCQLDNLLDKEKPFISHGAHTCSALRIPLLLYSYTGKLDYKTAFDNGIEKMKNCLGLSGACKCDEEIGTKSDKCIPLPELGYEYCGITELLLTLHIAVQVTGNTEYADMAEKLIFNAAQAARDSNEKSTAYLASDNQYSAAKITGTRWKYSPTHSDAAVCCTPNAARIMPYHVSRMWMKTEDRGLVAMFYGPCSLTTYIDNKKIIIDERTDYPFNETIILKINTSTDLNFPLKLRIPSWSKKTVVFVDGNENSVIKDDNFCTIRRIWNGESIVKITFIPEIETVKAIDGTIAVQRGPLLYAFQIPHVVTITKHYDLDNFCDIDYEPQEGAYWNYTLVLEKSIKDKGLVFMRNETGGYPWDYSNVRIKAKFLETTPNYACFEHRSESQKKFLLNAEPNESVELNLVPIGCTILRKTSFNCVDR